MTVEQDFLPYAVGSSANVLSQADYAALTSLLQNGLTSGIVPSAQLNKILRQASIMASIVGQFIVSSTGQAAIDDGTTATLLTNFTAGVRSLNRQQAIVADTGGAANTYAAVNAPALTVLPTASGVVQRIVVAHTNTGASTYNPDALGAAPIYSMAGAALQGGELLANGDATLVSYVGPLLNSSNLCWILTECTGAPRAVANGTASQHAATLGQVQGLVGASKLQSLSWSRASGALTINYAGGTLDFPNATLSNGAPVAGVVVPALSITIPSAATLGSISGQSGRLAVCVEYNGGSPVLAVTNLSGGIPVDESTLHSPTTISTGATSASTVYSASTVSANSPYRTVGYLDAPGNNSGWVTDPTNVKGAGGLALSGLASLGYGQTWQAVTRTSGTTYYNTTGKPIMLKVEIATTSLNTTATNSITVNGVALGDIAAAVSPNGTQYGVGTILIPVGASYTVVDTNASRVGTFELR